MKLVDPRVWLRRSSQALLAAAGRIPQKWRLPVLTGVGILWLGLLGGLGWLFLGEHKPDLIILDEAELEKAPFRDLVCARLTFQAVTQGVPMQIIFRNGEKSPVRTVGPADYLDFLGSAKLVAPDLMTDVRKDAPDYLIPWKRYSPYAAYKAYEGTVQGMSADMLLEAGSLSGHIWLDREFLEDAEPEANAEDGSLLICGDSRDGEVCLAFLDEQHERRAGGESNISPDYRFIAATNSKQSARQEIALYRRLVAEEPQVLAALAREGLQAVSVEKVELRRNKEKSSPDYLVEVTVANTDPGQRDVDGIDLHCYILDDRGKPVQRIFIPGNERQRISAGRRPRTYTFELDDYGDAARSRQIKLLEGSYRLQIIPYACRLDGKRTRELPNPGSELPEGVAFQNGVWMYNDAPLSLKDVPQLLTVDQKYASADEERLKAEMEARLPTILRLATWLHNKSMQSLVLSAPKVTTSQNDQKARVVFTATNADAKRTIRSVNLVFSFINAEGYPCNVQRFQFGMELAPGKQQELRVELDGSEFSIFNKKENRKLLFLLLEAERGNVILKVFPRSIGFAGHDQPPMLEDDAGKPRVNLFAFYQRDGVWYHEGTALPAEAAEYAEKAMFAPEVSPEDIEDTQIRFDRHQAWLKEQFTRLAPQVASRFLPNVPDNYRYRSIASVQGDLSLDVIDGKDVWMLGKHRIPDDIVREAGLEPWPRNEARKTAEAETPAAAAEESPEAGGSEPGTPGTADEGLTPESASAGGGGTPAAPAPEVAIAPSTPGDAPQAAVSQPSRETITATAGLAESSAAHKTVFAIRFGNTAASPARVSYRTFFLEGGKMFGRRESKLIITVPANGEQIVHLGSNKPELADIAARMHAGKVQMLVEIVDVEPAQ